jgi:DNA mismatch repair protein MSH4
MPNQLKALVWFATHFKDLATIMHERAGILNLNLAVEVSDVCDHY